nr:hypothetical protein [uncultured Thiodictyon sp.]
MPLAETMPVSWVRPPAESLMAVRESAPPIAKPWVSAEMMCSAIPFKKPTRIGRERKSASAPRRN